MNRAELARQAWAIMLANTNCAQLGKGDHEEIAADAVIAADALLSALQITPENVAESQQVQAGITLKPMMFTGPDVMGFTRGKVYQCRVDPHEDMVCCHDDQGCYRFRPIGNFTYA